MLQRCLPLLRSLHSTYSVPIGRIRTATTSFQSEVRVVLQDKRKMIRDDSYLELYSFQLTSIVLLGRLASRWRWVSKAKDPFVLDAQHPSSDPGVVLVVLPAK